MNTPMITDGGEVRKRYEIGKYQIVLIENPNSIGPIKYKFVFMAFKNTDKEPILTITSETNEMQAALLDIAAQSSPEIAKSTNPNKHFISVYHNGVRSNLGGSLDWAKMESFELKAFVIAKEKLGFNDDSTIKKLPLNKKTMSFESIIIIVIITTLVVMIIKGVVAL